MPSGLTVSALLLIPTLRHAKKYGVAPALLLREVGLAESDLETADTRITFAQLDALTRKARERTGDAHLGLHAAEYISAGAVGILGFVLMNCGTLGEALEKYCRYQRVAGEGIVTGLDRREADWTVRFAFYQGCPTPNRHLMEGMMHAVVVMMALLTGQVIRPTEVSFAADLADLADNPGDGSEHRRVFQCPVRFGRPHNAMIFPKDVIACRIVQPSRELLALFEKHTVEHLQKLDDELVYARKVGEECARMLRGDAPSIEAVAQKLAMSPRNLQLKLRQEGTSYRETLDRVRKDMALGHLKNRQVTVSEVAYLLGFSEPSVFHRSFKRWTGSTPGDFRQSLLA